MGCQQDFFFMTPLKMLIMTMGRYSSNWDVDLVLQRVEAARATLPAPVSEMLADQCH